MSDREGSRSRSPSADNNRSGSPAASRHSRSYSRSRSPSVRRSRSRSYKRSYSRSRSRSPYRKRRHSRSRSRSPRRSRGGHRDRGSGDGRRGYYRSHSRSPMSRRRRHVGNRDNPETSTCLGVFGLSLYTHERELRDVFSRYGPLENCNIVNDHHTGKSRGFGFVYFKDLDDAVEAKEKCTGIEIDGRRIRVDFSVTKRAHTPTPGIYLGKPTSGYRDRPRRRSPSPYYGRSRYSRSRSRSYSPRRY